MEVRTMRTWSIVILTAVSLLQTGCGMVAISPGYTPTGTLEPVFAGKARVNLQVTDVREKKVFFRTNLGDTPDTGKGALLRLRRAPREIFEEGFTEALQLIGCQVRRDAGITYDVRIERFLAVDREDTWSLVKSDIILEIAIKRREEVLASKTIFERDSEKIHFAQAWQHVVPPLLNRSLSRAIETAVGDPELLGELERGGAFVRASADSPTRAHATVSKLPLVPPTAKVERTPVPKATTSLTRPKPVPESGGLRSGRVTFAGWDSRR